MTTIAMAHWRRLDREGTDRCTLSRVDHGWMLTGQATWNEQGGVALTYAVRCAEDWSTLSADVTGRKGDGDVAIRLVREPGGWLMNDELQSGVSFCKDVDLSFTPATNLLPIRRLDFETGLPQPVRAAWLIPDLSALQRLDQTYTRARGQMYSYTSEGFEADLKVHPSGFVTHYPGLWEGWVDG